MPTLHGLRLLVILHLDSDPLQVKRIYSFLLSGLQMEVNRCQEDQKLSLPPMDTLFSMEAKRYGRQRLGLGVGTYCAVAIFEDLRFVNGTGSCWRKRLPLSNGRLDQNAVARSALIKISKSSELTSGRGKQNKAILILYKSCAPLFFFTSVVAIL
ncbi:hypothetical protein CK203_028920 [Vitis vinifera]|uniref:Uncharacterized protein n=1 Tax=Vitis vinifera TaxID=29760 RepID=A0A438IA29_VITVI|nr:hypothetical protein CK203_028920 [Vitis vinifera]